MYQVFTHPYTPQENGHIESFHAILSKTLNRYHFWSMDELDRCLESFYEKYNFHRLHSSIAYLTPDLFWKCWNDGLIDIKFNSIKKSMMFKLKIPYHQLSGNMNLREVPCIEKATLDGLPFQNFNKEMLGAETFQQPSV